MDRGRTSRAADMILRRGGVKKKGARNEITIRRHGRACPGHLRLLVL